MIRAGPWEPVRRRGSYHWSFNLPEGDHASNGALYGEPALLHQLTPLGFDGGSVVLLLRLHELFGLDGGDCEGDGGHHGDTAPWDFDPRLHGSPTSSTWPIYDLSVTNVPSADGDDPLAQWEGSDGRYVLFLSYGKHHHKASPVGWAGCADVAFGNGEWVVPNTWGSQVGVCEGSFVCPYSSCPLGGGYVCAPSFPWSSQAWPTTPAGLLNSLGTPELGYSGESVYSPARFRGGLGDDGSDEPMVIRDYLLAPTAATRVDLGGPGCTPVAVGTALSDDDDDGDGIPNACDPCPGWDWALWSNGTFAGVADSDGDGLLDGCDPCPNGPEWENANADGEQVLAAELDRDPSLCPTTGCGITSSSWGIGFSCVEEVLPFGVDGPGGFWTRLSGLSDGGGPDYPANGDHDSLWSRIHDGYLASRITIPGERTSRRFNPFPLLVARFVAPWLPVERLAVLDRVAQLGGTPVVFELDGVMELALWPARSGWPTDRLALGIDAEQVMREASVIAMGARVGAAAGRGAVGFTPGDTQSALEALRLWTYSGRTGRVHELVTGPQGAEVAQSFETGLFGTDARLAATDSGQVVLAVAGSPWSFHTVSACGTEQVGVMGNWTGSLELLAEPDAIRAVGVVSGRAGRREVAIADVVAGGTGAIRILEGVPARDGMWLGWADDGLRERILIGGGNDETGAAHSDVYAVGLALGAPIELVAPDDGSGVAVGPNAWLEGQRSDGLWQLRAVRARGADGASMRYPVYERLVAGQSFEGATGWRPSGLAVLSTPRLDVTAAERLAFGASCDPGGAPWYEPPGRWRFGEEEQCEPPLVCAPAEGGPDGAVEPYRLPRIVTGYAIAADELWVSTPGALERWSLESGPPAPRQTWPALGSGRPAAKARPVLGASETLVGLGRGTNLAVLRKNGAAWMLEGELETCDRIVALEVSGEELWAVGERHVTRVRADARGLRIIDAFDLYFDSADSGELFARRLERDTCDGSASLGPVQSAAAAGRVLVLGLEDRVVLLDATRPSRLPTVGSAPSGNHLREVATDGHFVYAHGHGPEQWQAWRIGPTAAFVPLDVEPGRAFALGRSFGHRYAARLTGTALHLAWW